MMRLLTRTILFVAGLLIIAPPMYQVFDRAPAVETVLWMDPNEVKAGDEADAVWTVRVLRSGCRGRVHRTHIDSTGTPFEFGTVQAVMHDDPVGTIEPAHRYTWMIPKNMKPGPAVFRRVTERGCGLWQWLFWPMKEVHEARYTVLPP